MKSVRVPAALEPLFTLAEGFVEGLFARMHRRPDHGTLHIGDDRYLLMRAESFYGAYAAAGADARDAFYATARAIGRADCRAFSNKLQVKDGFARMASGPVHFAHAGWAFVDILADSVASPDEGYFMHYKHPNTFESEVLLAQKKTSAVPACVFSAGYSAGWCSESFGVELHARELRCQACGDGTCEFVMATADNLDRHAARIAAALPGPA